MIDLALDPSDTRPFRTPSPSAPPVRTRLRAVALALVAASALAGFGVAASTLMAGLAVPAPMKRTSPSRAADWPDLKDGLPVLAGTSVASPQKPAAPEGPVRVASLPDPIAARPTPAAAALPVASSVMTRQAAVVTPAVAAAVPEPAARRIPNALPVTTIGAARQVTPLAPSRTAALQMPRASETVVARTEAEPAATVEPISRAATRQAGLNPPVTSEKPQRKAVAARKPLPAGSSAPPAPIASADASEPEETEVLGVKLPSLAPVGKKLKDGVDALGEAVRNVF